MGRLIQPLVGLVVLLLLAAAVASCGDGGGSATEQGAEAGGPGTKAEQLLEEASWEQLESGTLGARFTLDDETEGEAIQWRASTPFVRGEPGEVPQLNVRYEAAGVYGGEVTQERGRLVVLGDRTVWQHDGASYELDRRLGEDSGGSCLEAFEGIELSRLMKNLRARPVPESRSSYVEGELDMPAALRALDGLTAGSACGRYLAAAGVSLTGLKALEGQVASSLKKTEATFTIQGNRILTDVELGVWVELPAPDGREIDGRFAMNLNAANEVETVEGPAAEAAFEGAGKLNGDQVRTLDAGATVIAALWGALAGS